MPWPLGRTLERSQPSQFGELTCFAITTGANKDAAKLVEFLMNDGYLAWLTLAPEGKVPVRTGTTAQPTKFTDAWAHLETGVERTKPLSELYPPGVLKVLASSTDTMNRWGFPQGQGRLVGAQLATLPIPEALAGALNGTLSPEAVAEQARADLEQIAQTINSGSTATRQATAQRSTRGGSGSWRWGRGWRPTHVVVATTLEDAWRMS
jgi:multiple sugar transport system substrate-binding protein